MVRKPIWKLYYLPDRNVAFPGESVCITVDLKNCIDQYLYISNIAVEIPWFKNPWTVEKDLRISPNAREHLISFDLPVPPHIIGRQNIRVGVDTWRYDSDLRNWLNIGQLFAHPPMPVWMMSLPRYRAFISRSNRDYDKPVVEPIVRMIQQWGFQTVTVGINVFETYPKRISNSILSEIVKADCLIGIATPRDLSALDGFWKTLTWLHSEVTMAFTVDKPILLIVDESVKLEGLLAQEFPPKVRFSEWDLGKLYHDLSYIMPGFREWIGNKKREGFNKALQDIITGVAVGGFLVGVGYAIGKQQQTSHLEPHKHHKYNLDKKYSGQ